MDHNNHSVIFTKFLQTTSDLMLDTVKTWMPVEECHLLGESWQS